MPVQRMRITPQFVAPPVERRRFLTRIGAAFAGLALLGRPRPASASTLSADPFLGEIMLFAGTFAPRNWALCNGQLLSIAQNTALFSLLGTTYGGNGQTTFALPNLQGRAPIHFGAGPGLSNYDQGQVGGEENHLLTVAEMPAHSHTAYGDSTNGTSESPANALPARNPAAIPGYGPTPSAALATTHISNAGSSQLHNNMQPFLVMNYCISLAGIYPSRN